MKIEGIGRILKENMQGELPAWIDGLLTPLNRFIDVGVSALQNRLTFADNFSARIHTQTFNSGETVSINTKSDLKVSGVIPLYFGGKTLTQWTWDY